LFSKPNVAENKNVKYFKARPKLIEISKMIRSTEILAQSVITKVAQLDAKLTLDKVE